MDISTKLSPTPKTKPNQSQLGFGTIFTDHMFNLDYNSDKGWHNPRIEPYQALSLEPSTMVLHYGQAVFEGLKAYRTPSGAIQLFRPRDNIRRMNASARRMCIPELDEAFALKALKALLEIEKDWVPGLDGTSLYIRPTIIATDPFLGVRASHTYRYFVILSPVGAYYAGGFKPVKIFVTREHVRAVRGGVGEAKTPGNYAASLYAGELAQKQGYTQVLWLDGVEQKFIEEVGAMNIFFVIDNKLVTPRLNGSILPGITRNSVLQVAQNWGMPVEERQISIDELIERHTAGQLQEIFGAGTAAVIAPVGEIRYGDTVVQAGHGNIGPVAEKLYNTITGIQYGKSADTFGWIEPVV